MPVAARIAQLSRIPLLLAIYGIDAWTRPAGQAAKLAAKQTDHVLSISDVTLRRFQEWSGFPGEKTSVCPNGIHLEQYGIGQKSEALLRRHNLTGRKVIMTFGRLAPEERYKGFDEVLETLPALIEQEPDLCYMIAGDGGDRGRLEAKARNLGVASNVVFTGRISNKEKADYYRLADAFVMPSHGEGFGFVILEALACGIPVIASVADGTREAVRNGELGFVVDPDDSEGLKAAIFEALARPRRIPPGLEYFAFPNFAERLCCVFDNVIMNRQGSR
jgi:glycosyltransferase involved in cell wall biosynthesis